MAFWDDIKDSVSTVWDAAVRPALDATGLGVIADGIEEGVNAATDLAEDVVNEAARGLEDLGEDFVDAMEDLGEELEEGFSKDGWMTKFMEEYVPAGGFVTAIAHAAAGNDDYAKAAAVKGAITAIEAGASIAGTIALGPAGGVLGAGIGNGLGQMLEIAVREELPESVQHLFPPKDIAGALTEMGGAMLGGAAGAAGGKAFGAAKAGAKGLMKSAAKEAAEEAAEKTTAQLVKVAIMKKYLLSPAKPGIEAALDEAGLPVSERRMPPPQQIEDLEALEQKLTMAALADQRLVQQLDGASPEALQEYDRQIFTAKTRIDQMETPGVDEGQFYTHQHATLGEYYMRDGVVVWDLDELADANKDIELDKVGMTEQEVEKFIEDQWEQRFQDYGAEHPDWEVVNDPILGNYMVKEGKVVFGAGSPEQAETMYRNEEAQDRGFANADEYKEELTRSWQTAHEYAVEAGTATGEWQMGGQSDIVGPYMIKDGQIVWGASNPDEADEMLPTQLAQEKGFSSVEELREETARSWKIAHQYQEDAGTATGEWQMGGQSDIVGPYMIKDGVVVWGAENEEQAEDGLPAQLARNQGFESIDAMKEELATSWRMSHEYDVEAGTATDEWQTGGQTDIVGPYMIKNGEIVYGATTPEEAEAILSGEMPAPGDEMPVDFDNIEPELPEEVPVDEHGMPIELPEEVPVDEHGMPIEPPADESDVIAELRAQIAALQQQVENLSEERDDKDGFDEATESDPMAESIVDDIDDIDEKDIELDETGEPAGDGDGFDDDFDAPPGFEYELPEEVAVDENGMPVETPLADDEPSLEYTPAVMPQDPMAMPEADPLIEIAEEPALEYTPAIMPADPMAMPEADPLIDETVEFAPAVMPDELPVNEHGMPLSDPLIEIAEEPLTFEPAVMPENETWQQPAEEFSVPDEEPRL